MDFPTRPPIPEVQPVPVQPASAAPRPALLSPLAVLLAATALLGLWVLDPSRMISIGTEPYSPVEPFSQAEPDYSRGRIFNGIMVALWLAVIFFLWRGKSPARVIVLVGAVMPLLNLFAFPFYPNLATRVFLVLDAAFSAYLIHWLTRPSVVAYFNNPQRR